MEKKCGKCKDQKKLDDFSNLKISKDGKHTYCKKCMALEGRKYRKNNPEKFKETIKKYRKKRATNNNNICLHTQAKKLGINDENLIRKYVFLYSTKRDYKASKQEKQHLYDQVLYEMGTLTQMYNNGDKSIPIDEVDEIKKTYDKIVGL